MGIQRLLLCFFQGGNILSEKLLEEIVADGRLYLIPAIARDIYFLRLAVCSERTTSEDIRYSFGVIKSCTDAMMKNHLPTMDPKHKPTIDIDISPRRMHMTPEDDLQIVCQAINDVSLNGNSLDSNDHSPVGK